MLGYSRAGSGDTLREFEFLRLQAGADGVPAYLAQPGGRPATAFRLVRAGRDQRDLRQPAARFPAADPLCPRRRHDGGDHLGGWTAPTR